MKKILLFCTTACIMPTAAFAQSTGSEDFEAQTIIVTGTRTTDVGGIVVPDTTKPKAVLEQEIISRQNPGQSILDTVNLAPGVSFQNNDAYGSSGGSLSIRGFDSSRVSLTFDGIPLNDSGNYAIYSNQQLDPELIEQVNVNLGTTDVDSPTASAVGGTVNYRTRNPRDEMSARVLASVGEFNFWRVFGVVDTGDFTGMGTTAYLSASRTKNDNPFNNYGKVDKQQYNAKIRQEIGSNGDFVAVSGHYNQNRNNFFGSVRLRTDAAVPNGFPTDDDERKYNINFPCAVDTPQANVADAPNSCGTEFDRRFNPSNTGNIRVNSRFSLMDNLVLTADPYYQYVKANGGGTSTAREYGYDINPTGGRANCSTTANSATVECVTGYFGGSPYAGVDLNGDGDLLDTVTVLTPSQTRTHRYGVIAGLRWDINRDHSLRFSYTHDNANHRQTGQVGFVDFTGEPLDVFPINDPIAASSGNDLQKRDRQSYAILNQVAGEWRGIFGPLTVNAGLRVPFFKRDLENFCFTSSPSGFVECSGQNATIDARIAAQNPYVVNPTTGAISGFSPPQKRVLKYDKILPNVGAVYDFSNFISGFVSYAKGLSVPGTDNLYNAFYFPITEDRAKPDPETTDTFDAGVRYRSSKIQAQLAGWFTKFNNRLASAYDPELDRTVFRNLGRVDKYGLDASAAWSPIRELTLYTFGSLIKSEIKDNIQVGGGTSFDCDSATPGSPVATRNCAFTAGKYEGGSPKYMFGGSIVGNLGDFQAGLTAKRTGPRYIYDDNRPIFTGDVDCLPGTLPSGQTCASNGAVSQIFGAKAPAYWLVHLDARYNMGKIGLPETYVQFNVYNLFDEVYVGSFSSNLSQGNSSSGFYSSPPFAQIGAPRTISFSLNVGF